MLLYVWMRDDESGLLDDEFRDNDVSQAFDDSLQGSLGTQDVKSFLVVKVPDPPNVDKFKSEVVKPEYGPADGSGMPVIRRKRKHYLDWRSKFTADEIAIITDSSQQLPDGPTAMGGNVVAGVVEDLFTVQDFSRK